GSSQARGARRPAGPARGAPPKRKTPSLETMAKRLLAAPPAKPRQAAPGRRPDTPFLMFGGSSGGRFDEEREGGESLILSALAPQLAPYEAVLLSRAIRFNEPVAVLHVHDGKATQHVLHELELEPPYLLGMSDPDGDDVAVLLSGIRGVAPVLGQEG
ncbi:MAG: hypothetical protein M3P96_03110, partial [Actinomycetota bacterium]|nr:hypothetical protein [Actinomycetota bacterium]